MVEQETSECPNCQKILRVKSELFGRTLRCPHCDKRFKLSSIRAASKEQTTAERLEEARKDTSIEQSTFDSGTSSPNTTPVRSQCKTDNINSSQKKLGRFELRSVLGSGGFGRVYLAYDPVMDREIALKVPIFDQQDKARIQRFFSEAKAAGKLRHPNIVPTFDCGEIDGQYFIASAYIQGSTLSDKIKQSPITNRQAILWVRDLADALHYAHTQGIIHRDVKPHNVIIDLSDAPHIMDFGLAKRTSDDSAVTTDGALLGTPAYMSPEQARGDTKNIGPASDQYSLGVVMFELLTGTRPFEGSPHTVVAKVASSTPPRPQSLKPSIPRELDFICHKAMSPKISQRYTDCKAFANDLELWLRSKPLASTRTRYSIAYPIAIAFATLAVFAAFALLLVSYQDSSNDTQTIISEAQSNPSTSVVTTAPKSSSAEASEPTAQPSAKDSTKEESTATDSSPSSNRRAARGPIDRIARWGQWQTIFDGSNTSGFLRLGGFQYRNKMLIASGNANNAISAQEYGDFDLEFEWRIKAGANSGVYYREKLTDIVEPGNEFQIIDDDAYRGSQNADRLTGSLYGLIAAENVKLNPLGEWNWARIVCYQTKVEHWINHQLVVVYDTDSAEWKSMFVNSAFSGKASIGTRSKGYLLFQCHGEEVAFRNIRIRTPIRRGGMF